MGPETHLGRAGSAHRRADLARVRPWGRPGEWAAPRGSECVAYCFLALAGAASAAGFWRLARTVRRTAWRFTPDRDLPAGAARPLAGRAAGSGRPSSAIQALGQVNDQPL